MKIISHRGARGLAPENTLAALIKGIDHHADMLEFDVRVTKDHVAVLHHDPDLSDPNGQKLPIKDSTYKELFEHKPDLASLVQALETINARLPAIIEVKKDVAVGPIIKVIQDALNNGYPAESLLLGSKSQKTLVELHKYLPDIKKVVIEPWSGVRAHLRARQVNTDILFMNQLWLWSGFIYSVTRRGQKLYAYTVNAPKKAKAWQKYGLSGVITDYPDLFDKM